MIKALIFDLDDTLYPEHQFVLSGFHAVSEWLFEKYNIEQFYNTLVQIFHEGYRGDVFNRAFNTLNIKYTQSLIDKMISVYRGHAPQIRLYDDAIFVLNAFKDKYFLGLLTDGYLDVQKKKVAVLNLENCFHTMVYSDTYGRRCWKPNEFPYLRVMESLKCAGDECVYVADNPLKDFFMAKKLKWMTVRIMREKGEYANVIADEQHNANVEVKSLFELDNIL